MRHRKIFQPLASAFILAVLAVGIWWMSDHVVWLGDDLDYKYMMKGDIWQSWGFIRTWQDLLHSQLTHYVHVNGRFVAHTLVQLFCGMLGQHIFAIINAGMYLLLAVTLAVTGKVSPSRNSAGILTAAALSVICFVTKIMPTCQIGYIWAMSVNILWMSAFFSGRKPGWTKVAVMTAAGIIAGNWQESISIGVCAGLGFWWLSHLPHSRRRFLSDFDWRRSWMLLGYVAGTASNCFSPATMSRVATIATPFSDQLLTAAYSLPAVMILAVAATASFLSLRPGLSFSLRPTDGKILEGCLIIAMLFLLIFNFAIGVYSNRQLFGANMFAAILLLRILPGHRLATVPNILASCAVAAIWAVMYAGIGEVRRQYDDIARLHSISPDGVVEYDRHRVMTTGHPSDAKYYEDIAGQFDNDLHHSLMKDFKHRRGGKTLKLKPATVPDSEKVERYAPGHFHVTVRHTKGSRPREITVYGHYSLLGLIDIPASPRRMTILKYSRVRTPYATATIIPEYPLFTADSIALHTPAER